MALVRRSANAARITRAALRAVSVPVLLLISACGSTVSPAGTDSAMSHVPRPETPTPRPVVPVSTPIPASVDYAGPDGHPVEIDGIRWYWCLESSPGD
jgi:hypothetical protein